MIEPTAEDIGRADSSRNQYHGKRRAGGVFVTVNGDELDPRNDLVNHSPDGFEWGCRGGGTAQLAFALLAKELSQDDAMRLYQRFKDRVILFLDKDEWTLTGVYIREWAKRQ